MAETYIVAVRGNVQIIFPGGQRWSFAPLVAEELGQKLLRSAEVALAQRLNLLEPAPADPKGS